ncbi:MAG: IS1595 family transposase [bacterium]|nr:IS1595 family transposase [bacterium]
MSKSTISTFELFQMFPDQESARLYFEAQRWPDGATCPACGEAARIGNRKDGFYRCNACLTDFTVRTNTIFERSKVPLHKWLYAMYLLVTSRKGISSLQLAKQIGVTQKTAWFMLGRLREACGNDPTELAGIVEIDECYIGGKEAAKHEAKRKKIGRGGVGKTAVIAGRERETGHVKAEVRASVTGRNAVGFANRHVQVGSTIHTDESAIYNRVGGLLYTHETINHGAGEYARGDVTTNGIESVFAVLKRGIHGVYHHASPKHLHRYVGEFAFRLGDGDVSRHTLDRLASLFGAALGCRLTYKDLIA